METPPDEPRLTNNVEILGRRTTRSALSEIPARLGVLTLQERDLMETTPGPMVWHVNNNLPSSMISPSPSPDELVIQSRGRRRVPVIWSPDIDHKKPAPSNRTPVKTRDTIVLRSTPRKRLLMGEEICTTPEKRHKSPSVKKQEKQGNYAGPLEDALKGLSQEQLINLVQAIVQTNPHLEQSIKDSLPAPDLRPLEEQLNYLKKNIFKSLPNSRLTSRTDSPAYNRTVTHLQAFKKCVLEQGRQLVECQHWTAVVDYVLLAWSYVDATPLWDNPPHNQARKQCFKSLSSQLMIAIKKGNFPEEQLVPIQRRLQSFNSDNEDREICIKYISNFSMMKNIDNL